MPIRTTLAALALTLAGASAALAAPVPSLANATSLVMSVADDSTSENDAIKLEQNKLPAIPGETKSHVAPMAKSQSSAGDNYEAQQLQDEKTEK
jgi:hypothetical protein